MQGPNYLLILLLLACIVAFGAYMLPETTRKLDRSEVFRWCSEIEREKQSSPKGSSGSYEIRPDKLEEFFEACKKTEVSCRRVQTVQRKKPHHGGSYYVTLEEVNIVF